jgi:predicted nucleic acid-binding protein
MVQRKLLKEVEVLPYAVIVEKSFNLYNIVIKDKDDIKFLECTFSGKAHYLVSGDKENL